MLIIVIFLLKALLCNFTESMKSSRNASAYDLADHTTVTSSNVFPYVAAILSKSKYLCAGALIDDFWVLTVADSLYLYRDSLRLIRVRLGSINNKKGGRLLPVKLIEIHPYFDDNKPEYDIALIKLAERVRLTPSLNPIRLQRRVKEVMATHFIVTSWPSPQQKVSSAEMKAPLEDSSHRRRMLQVAHLHPMKSGPCADVLEDLGFSKTNLMCLDQGAETDPCSRDIGAPVVLNGILWGLISSWVPDDCDLLPGPSFVVLASAPNTSSWIHATMRNAKWHQWMQFDVDYEEYDDDD